jgi:membrane associated rhomboid family serine protease
VIPLKDDIPTRRTPVITIALILINVVVYFLFEHGGLGLGNFGNHRVLDYGAVPREITDPGFQLGDGDQPSPWITILTSMFLHGSLLHLAGNMLFLWIFGNNIEDSMGRVTFVLFYILGGLAAIGLQVVADPNSMAPTVGASGAIAGVLGAYARLYPRARVVTLVFIVIIFTVVTLPALLVLGVWFLLQLLPAFSQPVTGAGGGVAYFAHIGGFLFGVLAIKLFATNIREDYDQAHRIPVY